MPDTKKRSAPSQGSRRLDRKLPKKTGDRLPESEMYKKMRGLERRVDEFISRKRMEISEVVTKTPVQQRILRVFISTHHTNQEFQLNEGEAAPGQPAWTLRIEGRLLKAHELDSAEGQKPTHTETASNRRISRRKFSSFLRSIQIELDPEVVPKDGFIEWRRTMDTVNVDGFEVRRIGNQPLNARILLEMHNNPPRYEVSKALKSVIGVETGTHSEITMALWQYMRQHKLQDPSNPTLLRMDKRLAKVFQVENMEFSELPTVLQEHLSPLNFVDLSYDIKMEPINASEMYTVYDIVVDIDRDMDGNLNKALNMAPLGQEISQWDERIALELTNIDKAEEKRAFMLNFADNPHKFIEQWMNSQERDLRIMKNLTVPPEAVRDSKTYQKPWVHEAVWRYLASETHEQRLRLKEEMGDQG
eukprot:Clim_evm21s246 gene=Clim_evmTU21s246